MDNQLENSPDVITPKEEAIPPSLPEQGPILEVEPKPIIETSPDAVNAEQPVIQPSPVPQVPVTPITDPAKDQSEEVKPVETVQSSATEKIEKPWIDKAEEIISSNKNNPFKEEQEHENLQIEYLRKRFGKDIKRSTD